METLKPLTINVIVATYNRADSLRRTLTSFARAESAPTLRATVTIVDNNSSDATRAVVEAAQAEFEATKLVYIFEPRQGKSFALNTGLAASDADLIGMIDDDEEVAADWFVQVARLFGARWNEIDFASGKMLPRWQTEPAPAWASPALPGIGWRDYGEIEWTHDATTPILCGGHAIIKREAFDELGFYSENIGPTGKNLFGCEDDVMYDKLLSAGKKGVYCPRLVIYHFVPDYRLTANYFRRWCYDNGASQHLMDVYYKPFRGARIFGVPRFMYRTAMSSLWQTFRAKLRGETANTMVLNEHGFLVFAGYFYERNLKNSRIAKPLGKLARRWAPSVAR